MPNRDAPDNLPEGDSAVYLRSPGWDPASGTGNRGVGVFFTRESATRVVQRPQGKSKDKAPALKIVKDGQVTWRDLGNDLPAIRQFLSEAATTAGTSLERVARAFPRGRLTTADANRRELLASIVVAAIKEGAKQEALGEILDCDKRRISELLKRDQTTRNPKPDF
jgi:hypothetical protein